MAIISSDDADFRICRISFQALIEIQLHAERQGWGTRWTSTDALRSQVQDDFVILQSLMREERGQTLRAYRCLVLFSQIDARDGGGLATIDVDPERFKSLERLDRDPDVRKALVRMFSLAMSGISMVSKK